jgi:hypothetical protein
MLSTCADEFTSKAVNKRKYTTGSRMNAGKLCLYDLYYFLWFAENFTDYFRRRGLRLDEFLDQ